jgi:hypothetical protein
MEDVDKNFDGRDTELIIKGDYGFYNHSNTMASGAYFLNNYYEEKLRNYIYRYIIGIKDGIYRVYIIHTEENNVVILQPYVAVDPNISYDKIKYIATDEDVEITMSEAIKSTLIFDKKSNKLRELKIYLNAITGEFSTVTKTPYIHKSIDQLIRSRNSNIDTRSSREIVFKKTHDYNDKVDYNTIENNYYFAPNKNVKFTGFIITKEKDGRSFECIIIYKSATDPNILMMRNVFNIVVTSTTLEVTEYDPDQKSTVFNNEGKNYKNFEEKILFITKKRNYLHPEFRPIMTKIGQIGIDVDTFNIVKNIVSTTTTTTTTSVSEQSTTKTTDKPTIPTPTTQPSTDTYDDPIYNRKDKNTIKTKTFTLDILKNRYYNPSKKIYPMYYARFVVNTIMIMIVKIYNNKEVYHVIISIDISTKQIFIDSKEMFFLFDANSIKKNSDKDTTLIENTLKEIGDILIPDSISIESSSNMEQYIIINENTKHRITFNEFDNNQYGPKSKHKKYMTIKSMDGDEYKIYYTTNNNNKVFLFSIDIEKKVIELSVDYTSTPITKYDSNNIGNNDLIFIETILGLYNIYTDYFFTLQPQPQPQPKKEPHHVLTVENLQKYYISETDSSLSKESFRYLISEGNNGWIFSKVTKIETIGIGKKKYAIMPFHEYNTTKGSYNKIIEKSTEIFVEISNKDLFKGYDYIRSIYYPSLEIDFDPVPVPNTKYSLDRKLLTFDILTNYHISPDENHNLSETDFRYLISFGFFGQKVWIFSKVIKVLDETEENTLKYNGIVFLKYDPSAREYNDNIEENMIRIEIEIKKEYIFNGLIDLGILETYQSTKVAFDVYPGKIRVLGEGLELKEEKKIGKDEYKKRTEIKRDYSKLADNITRIRNQSKGTLQNIIISYFFS